MSWPKVSLPKVFSYDLESNEWLPQQNKIKYQYTAYFMLSRWPERSDCNSFTTQNLSIAITG